MRCYPIISVSIFYIILLYPVVCLDPQELKTLKSIGSQLSLDDQDLNACAWEGVTCIDAHVTQISLPGQYLKGTIPKEICQLPYLERLNLARNLFEGILDMTGCINLTHLDLSSNLLLGNLSSLARFRKLCVLDLSRNKLGGGLFEQMFKLTNLRSLNLSYNFFRALNIQSIRHLTELEEINLSHNLLSGKLPGWIFNGLTSLRYLDLSQNNLSGPIPEIFLPNLTDLLISDNRFSGPIPSGIFTRLKNLVALIANNNELSGTIPEDLGSIATLRSLHLGNNNLVGKIPQQLFVNAQLQSIDFSYNYLEGTIPESIYKCKHGREIILSNNKLAGIISSKVGDLSELQYFEVDGNFIHGDIPQELSRCRNLTLLNLARNRISGQIPIELGSLGGLQRLYLQQNRLNGKIPRTLLNCQHLASLDLSSNHLSGTIPYILFLKMKNLQSLHLHNNGISGSIPSSIGNLMFLRDVNLAYNNLSGEIPKEIGLCANLQIALNLSHNSLEGNIPVRFSSLTRLVSFDLSHNSFSGEIPESLEQMQSLIEFDVSYNQQLTGTLPHFCKATVININETFVSVPLERVTFSAREHISKANLIAVFIGVLTIAIGITLLTHKYKCLKYLHETAEKQESSILQCHLMDPQSIRRENIDFEKALKATLDPANVILTTNLHTYYKVVMPCGTAYTMKEFNWMMGEILEAVSCNKLGAEFQKHAKLSHPNIMMPLAYALKNNLAVLFYENVHKGSLRELLTESSLDWSSRYKLALGIAQGLAYLHECCPPIIHLDINSKNILVKSPTEPQIAETDFCLIINHSTRSNEGILSAIIGSIGYIPPEYAYTMKVTLGSNVYSFGVVLLELLTGRPPIKDGMVLTQWVQGTPSRNENWEQILDPRITRSSFQERNCVISVLRIALACTDSSPATRPKMNTVVGMLQSSAQT